MVPAPQGVYVVCVDDPKIAIVYYTNRWTCRCPRYCLAIDSTRCYPTEHHHYFSLFLAAIFHSSISPGDSGSIPPHFTGTPLGPAAPLTNSDGNQVQQHEARRHRDTGMTRVRNRRDRGCDSSFAATRDTTPDTVPPVVKQHVRLAVDGVRGRRRPHPTVVVGPPRTRRRRAARVHRRHVLKKTHT